MDNDINFTMVEPPASNAVQKRQLAKLLDQFGCVPDAPDGQVLPAFSPQLLAQAIENEIKRCHIYGWNKITVHMDLKDAIELMNYLKGT
jgi:hypothetical protein